MRRCWFAVLVFLLVPLSPQATGELAEALRAKAGFAFFAVSISAQTTDATLIVRVGEYVERYYARAQTLVATETVTVQPVSRRLEPEGPARQVTNEVRIEWDALVGSQPREVREMVSAKGPRRGSSDQPVCLDPRSYTLEPLAFILPSNRDQFRLSVGRMETIGGVRAQRIDYVPRTPEPPRVRWDGKCGWVDNFGRTRGSIWVDPATGEVRRFDERLSGKVDLPGPGNPDAPRFVAERADTTIEYKKFAFVEPDETLLLPSRVESVTFIRNSVVPRVRLTRTFTDYRRFLTGGRIRP
jgi:hypothetical protein